MLKIAERSEVKKQQNGNNFAVRHLTGTVSVLFTVIGQTLVFFDFFFIFFAEIVCNTENSCNFV
jgi:hypothetical protein